MGKIIIPFKDILNVAEKIIHSMLTLTALQPKVDQIEQIIAIELIMAALEMQEALANSVFSSLSKCYIF